MGTPMFAVPILKSLYQNGYPVTDVYTQPPQKSQRGQKINKSPIQGIAETLNLNFRTPHSLNDNKQEFDGLLSTCVQHEINHLDGKLIIDHLSKLKKDIIIKKISKIKKNPDRIIV